MFRQRFVMVVDQLDERPPQLQTHLRIDDDLEGSRSRIRLGEFLFQGRLIRGNELIIEVFFHVRSDRIPLRTSGKGWRSDVD